jgi:hypothetical protein
MWITRGTGLFDSQSRINHGPPDFLIAPRLAILRPACSNARTRRPVPSSGGPVGREGSP